MQCLFLFWWQVIFPGTPQKPHFFPKKPEKVLENCRAFFQNQSFSRGTPGKWDFWPIFGVIYDPYIDPDFGVIFGPFFLYLGTKYHHLWFKNRQKPPKLRSKSLFWGWFTPMLHNFSGQNSLVYKNTGHTPPKWQPIFGPNFPTFAASTCRNWGSKTWDHCIAQTINK